MSATLYIVATPIGNLQDLTPRAITVLQQVDCIAAEDTRKTRHLLQHFSINTPLLALHDHNEAQACQALISRIQQGESMALVSDAGTPLISDPGYRLVCAAHEVGIKITPIPGACAAIVALSAAGLPTDHFIFEGFLPVQASARRQRLQQLQHESRTLVFYEAKHRLLDCLQDMQLVFGEARCVTLARELTKLHETIIQKPLNILVSIVADQPEQQLGEMVLVVHGAPIIDQDEIQQREGERVLNLLLADQLPASQAVRLAARITGASKNILYNLTHRKNPEQ